MRKQFFPIFNLIVCFASISLGANEPAEIPAGLEVRGHVSNESIFGGNGSIVYFVRNSSKNVINVPLAWICDSGRYIEVQSGGVTISNNPGGLRGDGDGGRIAISPNATIVLLGPVPKNEVFLERKDGHYAVLHSVFGDSIMPFDIQEARITTLEKEAH